MTGIEVQRLPAVVGLAQVEQQELVGLSLGELVLLDIDTAHPIALALQLLDQMAADEATGAADQGSFHLPAASNPAFERIPPTPAGERRRRTDHGRLSSIVYRQYALPKYPPFALQEFLRRYENDELSQTLAFAEWIGEYRLRERLREKAGTLQEIRFAD